ncbi:MAG TPA: phosphoesterase [Planctomycetaceae bacterium]|nr:phosphoesterase [Planctomycetaceae bacterium]HIQ20417.1 phosphoesterase [Planctomycetota bacterium]
MADVSTERVLVVPTALFRKLGYFQGFSTHVDRYLLELLRPEHTTYRPRREVEEDPEFKQLIPYVIFRYRDGDGRDRVFQYTRGIGQGEERLHRKRSVGIGGHICVYDARGNAETTAYEEGMRRELGEEVIIDTPYADRCVGLINDDQTAVGRVHLGVVHLFDVQRPAVRPREAEIVRSGFLPLETILAEIDEFETWSQYCLDALFVRGLAPARE